MKRYLRGALFLLPAVLVGTLLTLFALKDEIVLKILKYELYIILVCSSLIIGIVLLAILWQWTRAGIYLIFKIDLRMSKKDTE